MQPIFYALRWVCAETITEIVTVAGRASRPPCRNGTLAWLVVNMVKYLPSTIYKENYAIG